MSQGVDNWWYYSNRRSTVVIVSNSTGCCSTSLKKTTSACGHLNRHKSHDVRSHQPGMLSRGEIICHHNNLLWKSSVLWNLVRYRSSWTFESIKDNIIKKLRNHDGSYLGFALVNSNSFLPYLPLHTQTHLPLKLISPSLPPPPFGVVSQVSKQDTNDFTVES